MAFAAIGASLGSGQLRYKKELAGLNPGESIESVENRYANVRQNWRLLPQGNIPGNAVTSSQPVTFYITKNETLALRNGKSIYFVYKPYESGGSAAVVVTWAESIFNATGGIEYLMDGTVIESIPMMQVIIARLEEEDIDEYKYTASYMGHDETLVYTSSTSIAASATAIFQIPIPSILPHDEAFWFGALGTHVLGIRINTGINGIKASGTGTVAILSDGMSLRMECISVSETQYDALRAKWANYNWDSEKWTLNEATTSSTLVSSGESPKIKLDAFKDLTLERIFVYQLATRRSPTSGAMFQWVVPADTALYHVEDQSGVKMFSTEKEYYKYNKVTVKNDQYASTPMVNAPFLVISANPDLPASRLQGKKTLFNFTGQEYFVWTDFGATAATLYVDMIGVSPTRWNIKDGVISKLY